MGLSNFKVSYIAYENFPAGIHTWRYALEHRVKYVTRTAVLAFQRLQIVPLGVFGNCENCSEIITFLNKIHCFSFYFVSFTTHE